eukprot:NODE_202_length_14999_cov_0.270067.p5 type:complete len:394 gc:universal NODE_202_length_14999_cov_0.270067:4889-3708(-)
MLSIFSTLVVSHSHVDKPEIRKATEISTYTFKNQHARNTNCGMSKDRANGQVLTRKRGEKIDVEWFRNNHNGGFMRYSISSFDNSDVVDDKNGIFDDPKRIIHYECAEKVCKTGSHTDPNGPDPSKVENSNRCYGDVTVPNWVPDGKYTIQAVWYGTGYSKDEQYRGLRYYVSCFDFYVKGGDKLEDIKGYTDYVVSDSISVPTGEKCYTRSTFTGGDVNSVAGAAPTDCKWFTATKGTIYGCANDDCYCRGETDDKNCYQRSAPPEYESCSHKEATSASNNPSPQSGTGKNKNSKTKEKPSKPKNDYEPTATAVATSTETELAPYETQSAVPTITESPYETQSAAPELPQITEEPHPHKKPKTSPPNGQMGKKHKKHKKAKKCKKRPHLNKN